jgi:hypothetical protein
MSKNPIVVGDVYSNCSIYHPNGDLMCHCALKKMNWYLKKGLAEKISENSIRLLFEPGGDGHSGDKYYLEQRENQCVVCGTKENLTKHHVVPHQYRKNMPEEHKSHTHFDVLCVCVTCHEDYEKEATKLNRKLADDLGLDFHRPAGEDDLHARKVAGYISSLRMHGDKIPEERIAIMLDIIGEYFEREVTLADIEELVIELDGFSTEIYSPGKYILNAWIESGRSILDFKVLWRRHFLDTTSPKYMSKYWLADYETRIY